MSTFIDLPPPPTSHPPSSTTLLIVGPVGAGKRTIARSVIAAGKLPQRTTSTKVIIRTRESILRKKGEQRGPTPGRADYMMLVVDSSRANALSELEEALASLPGGWWKYLTVGVTKVDLRTRRCVALLDIRTLVNRFCTNIPIFFISPFTLDVLGKRIERLVRTSRNGSIAHLRDIHLEYTSCFTQEEEMHMAKIKEEESGKLKRGNLQG